MVLKTKTWDNPNKMHMDSGHKTFDRQTNCISTGNIIANTQLARFVRGELDTYCNGLTWDVGHLRDFDLRNWPDMPHYIRELVKRHTDGTKQSIWVSEFHHYNGERKIVHGYILARDRHLLNAVTTGPTYKSSRVLQAVEPYVVEQEAE